MELNGSKVVVFRGTWLEVGEYWRNEVDDGLVGWVIVGVVEESY